MKYLFSDRKRVGEALKNKFIYLFLDHDGTLAPIAQTPDKAIIPKETKDLLRQLSKVPDCKIAIVSGRALKDISRRIGLKNVTYVGNHGFEVKGPKVDFKGPMPIRYRNTLKKIKLKLKKSLSLFKGVIIEDKGFSLSVHYRLADKGKIPVIKTRFYTIIFPYEFRNNIQVKSGKMVIEVRPPVSWNKGKVVSWLLSRRLFEMKNKKTKILPIYIGDDNTDEDAFESIKDIGITVFVGKPSKTKAQFYLKNTEEVAKFLEMVLKSINPGASWRKKR